MIQAAPLEAYSQQDREFFAFWYSHMQGDLMQPPLAGISHSTARYIWDSALATPKPEPMTDSAKLTLIRNFFSERWAQDQAMNLLHDYDQHYGITKEQA